MQYVIPKQQATAATVELERLTDEQLNQVINTIINTAEL